MTGEWRELAPLVLADLRSAGVSVDEGLTHLEREALENALGFGFPPDLAALLAAGLPTGGNFPDWRGPVERLVTRFRAPVEGLLFDVQHNALWLEAWGARPGDPGEALDAARAALASVPPLVPVWGHRYLPSEPRSAGNPVLSVMQADIVAYGNDLADYLAREFGLTRRTTPPDQPRQVPFWSQFVG